MARTRTRSRWAGMRLLTRLVLRSGLRGWGGEWMSCVRKEKS
jgi:hypothetical protein